jgi:putative endonuclease
MRDRRFYVYILASRSRTLYVGITNDLARRLREHRARQPGSFTARYRIDRLVYFETFYSPLVAIAREKQLKGWRRERKIALIEDLNPRWRDLDPFTGRPVP